MAPLTRRLRLMLLLLPLLGWFVTQKAFAATTFTVTDSSDLSDADLNDNICDTNLGIAGNQCSLRAAIEQLNDIGPDATAHHIEFNISQSGVITITPASPLPSISVPVVIDGASQPGASCPTSNTMATLPQ